MLATVPRMQLSIATIASVVATRPKTVDRPNDPPSSSEKCENTSSQLTRSHVAAINARPVDETQINVDDICLMKQPSIALARDDDDIRRVASRDYFDATLLNDVDVYELYFLWEGGVTGETKVW